MKKEELTVKSVYDNLPLGITVRIPDQSPTGIIQFVHGMSEHRGRYHDIMEYFTQIGYVTVIHDHRGHGESVIHPDDYGYFYKNGADAIVEDAHQITLYIKNRFPDLPLVLLGHSMGSMVVRCYTRKYDKNIDGLIVCGSPSRNAMAKLGLFLVSIMRIIKGEYYRSKLVQKIAFGAFNRNIQNPTSENSWICSNEEVVREYDNDSRCGFIFTLNGFATLFKLMICTYRKKGWTLNKPSLPILFIAGEQDPCIVNRKEFEQAAAFMNERGYKNCEKKLYSEMRHEILNENGKEAVWNDIKLWIEKQHLNLYNK